jgi:hypothetical protein
MAALLVAPSIKTENPLPRLRKRVLKLAGWTGLEPATFCVTGRRSNQLSYHPGNRERRRTLEFEIFKSSGVLQRKIKTIPLMFLSGRNALISGSRISI